MTLEYNITHFFHTLEKIVLLTFMCTWSLQFPPLCGFINEGNNHVKYITALFHSLYLACTSDVKGVVGILLL